MAELQYSTNEYALLITSLPESLVVEFGLFSFRNCICFYYFDVGEV